MSVLSSFASLQDIYTQFKHTANVFELVLLMCQCLIFLWGNIYHSPSDQPAGDVGSCGIWKWCLSLSCKLGVAAVDNYVLTPEAGGKSPVCFV